MSNYRGFWSYVHQDDAAEQGRISNLARDVVSQYEMLTGETIDLFLDRDALNWGDDWRDQIDASLASVAFFIPVMTPRYFMRPECRRELQVFARRAEQLGVKDLVLPLHYVNVPSFSLENETDRDNLVDLVCKFQWKDWRDLRFQDVTTEAYRRGVSDLAERLVSANQRAEEVLAINMTLETPEILPDGYDDDAPGLIDRIAKAEDSLPDWTETIQNISQEISTVGELMLDATSDLNQASGDSGRVFKYRQIVARRLAKKLDEPANRITSLGNEFVAQLNDVDDGFRALIEKSLSEVEQNPSLQQELCKFFGMLSNLSLSAREGLGSSRTMIEAIAPIEQMSRDLRPVLRRLRKGLTTMVETVQITDSWMNLIEASGVDCPDIQ